jgi:hypothetical protein
MHALSTKTILATAEFGELEKWRLHQINVDQCFLAHLQDRLMQPGAVIS